mgnify:CR=1 FL=1
MRIVVSAIAIWLALPLCAGAIAHFGFGKSFWAFFLIALGCLAANALIIEWEDRQSGGWSE